MSNKMTSHLMTNASIAPGDKNSSSVWFLKSSAQEASDHPQQEAWRTVKMKRK